MTASIHRSLALALVAGAAALVACMGASRGAPPDQPPRPLSIAEVEKKRPEGEVTVQFRVEETGTLLTLRRETDPPFDPIQLEAAVTGDKRGKFQVTLVGKALTLLHSVGIEMPAEHLRGRVVQVTGKVQAVEYPRITRDGKVEIPKDHWTNYEMVISDPERFYVNPEPQPKPAAEGKPVSPGEAVAKAQEPLTVEFTVGSVGMLLGPVPTGADPRPPIRLDWDGKLKGGGRFYVMLWGDATEGGSARFKGKTVRVTGRIQAAQPNDASTDYYFTIKASADIKVVK